MPQPNHIHVIVIMTSYRIIIWEICTLSWLGSKGPIDAPLLSSENIDELRLSDMSEENTEASENVDIVDGGRAVSDVREPRQVNITHAIKFNINNSYSGFPTKFRNKIPRFSKVFFSNIMFHFRNYSRSWNCFFFSFSRYTLFLPVTGNPGNSLPFTFY